MNNPVEALHPLKRNSRRKQGSSHVLQGSNAQSISDPKIALVAVLVNGAMSDPPSTSFELPTGGKATDGTNKAKGGETS